MKRKEQKNANIFTGVLAGSVATYYIVESIRWGNESMGYLESDIYKKAMIGLVILFIVGAAMTFASGSDGPPSGGSHLR